MHRLTPLLFLLLLSLSGCEPEEITTPAGPPTPEQVAAMEQNRKAIEALQTQQQLRIEGELRLRDRKAMLKALGPVESWQVSTERDGKVDDELVKFQQSGYFDNSLKEAFSHRGLELKFFIHLPKAIAALKQFDPRPEYCDLICGEPVAVEDVKDYFTDGVVTSDDTDASGKPRKWYRDKEVSFGVVDNHIAVVRIHVNAKTFDWQQVNASR
jgi:hypothetical protein